MAERRECVIAEVANPKSRSQPRKLSFDNGGDFIRQTRREVDAYLSAPRIRTRGRIELYAKGVVAFVLLLVSWATLVLGHPGWLLGLLAFGGLILGTSLTAFCVMHDANHGAYFRTRRLNHLMGWTADALLGLSSYAWRVKHNVAHHTYTNVDGYDADITQMPFARLMPVQAPRPWYRLQHYYIWALYCVMGLRWQTVGDLAAFARGSIGTSALRFPRRWDLVGLIGGKVIFITWAIVVPLLVLPLVGRPRRLSRLFDGREPDHGRDLPARTLRRGGRLRLSGRTSRSNRGCGRCTRSRPRSTSARATGS